MSDIIEQGECDKDIVEYNIIENQFKQNYTLLAEKAVSLKKSYVNKLNGSKSLKLVVSLTNNGLETYEFRESSICQVCRLSGHGKSVTEVLFSPQEDYLVYSCGLDGLVKLWDTRTSGTCVQEYKDEEVVQVRPLECLDISCNGRVLCAGSQLVQDDAFLIFWDQRVTKPLGGYWNSHTDDITQVKFHKEKSAILATGASDGLLNVFNIMEQTEDDALVYSLNAENSIEKLTWLDDENVSCISQSEDLQIWNASTGDAVRTCTRSNICRSIKRTKEDDCYAVDTFMSARGTPTLLAGSHGGSGDCLRSVTITERKLQPCSNFVGNKQVVRCCWYQPQSDLLVTSGESGLIDVWSGAGAEAGCDATRRNQGTHNRNRHKPY